MKRHRAAETAFTTLRTAVLEPWSLRPRTWYGLLLYEAREDRQVTHISKDRDATRGAVLRWLEHIEAPLPAARG